MTATKTAPAADADDPSAPLPPRPDAGEPDFAPVIRSKIQPPALRADTLTRERLVRRLDDALRSRLVLVVADAGYGKTTLLADYAARSGLRTLWYRLGNTDVDSITWANHLVAACQEVDPTFGGSTAALLSSAASGGPPSSAYIDSFLGELSRWTQAPTMLVLDDFHEVDWGSEAAAIVGRLIDDAPDWLCLVISSRRRPSIPLGRLAASSQLAEISTDDLRFSLEETERLFVESYSQPIADDVLHTLDRRTRGWAASLQLFHGSIRGRSTTEVRRLADNLSGSSGPLFDYLAEEVLANVPDHIEDILVRAALLEIVTPGLIGASYANTEYHPIDAEIARWIDEAVSLSLLTRASASSNASQLHPLLRDFLQRQLQTRFSTEEIRTIHACIAERIRHEDPLTAAHHYIEGRQPTDAMECLATSILSTIGSGKWGDASRLLGRLGDTPADPVVAAIRARRLIDEGNSAAAERLLATLDVSTCSPAVRAVFRQTKLALGWRLANRELLLSTLDELQHDPETPEILQDIAQIFVDGGTVAGPPAPLQELGGRLVQMAAKQRAIGHTFFSAVSSHNACVAFYNAGDLGNALGAGLSALDAFDQLGFEATERASTRSMIAECLIELGEDVAARDHADGALKGHGFADVPAELSIMYSKIGDRERALELLAQANVLHGQGRSDVGGVGVIDIAAAMTLLPFDPAAAIKRLSSDTFDWTLDLGQSFQRVALLAQAHLLDGDTATAVATASRALPEARRRGANPAAAKLRLLIAICRLDEPELMASMAEARSLGRLNLAELADAICQASTVIPPQNPTMRAAIADAPKRWLAALRRQMGRGAPEGNVAATLLDELGELEDVARLRAYAKAYRARGPAQNLGLTLMRNTSPRLHIQDLGRVTMAVGDRTVPLSAMRRKAAALLMFLTTRPNFTAAREQALDELWPDADPESAGNSLNQALYYLRRDIDPWYEDGVSADYIHLEGELIWLDSHLVTTESAAFVSDARQHRLSRTSTEALEIIRRYKGEFAPEFEYEEWASSWRARLHAILLEVADTGVQRLIRAGRLEDARDVAVALLDTDPTATDMERRLVWLHWQLGARSASRAQYQHLEALEKRDGMDPTPFEELVAVSSYRE